MKELPFRFETPHISCVCCLWLGDGDIREGFKFLGKFLNLFLQELLFEFLSSKSCSKMSCSIIFDEDSSVCIDPFFRVDFNICSSKYLMGKLCLFGFNNENCFRSFWVIPEERPFFADDVPPFSKIPAPVASSAYQIWKRLFPSVSLTFCPAWIRGTTPRAYICMAHGSPWVVPSTDMILHAQAGT